MTDQTIGENAFSFVMIALLKGVVYCDDNPKLWQNLLNLQARIRDYAKSINLEPVIFEDEGFAYLKTIENEGNNNDLPKLISKRQLSYPVSLLLALLRRRLAEHDATSSESRLIVSREEIVEMIRTFLPDSSNEVRVVNQIDSYINKIMESGFIRRLKTEKNRFEIRRILKAFIDAKWLGDFNRHLENYRYSHDNSKSVGEVSHG